MVRAPTGRPRASAPNSDSPSHVYYAVRLDGDDSASLSTFLALLGCYFIVRESVSGQNVHMHAVVYSSEKLKTIRSRFLRAFPACSGNGSYSLTTVDDVDKYHRYLCKGADKDSAPEVVGRQGLLYTDEWVASQHESYWQVNDQIASSKSSRKRSVFEIVYDQCVSEDVYWNDSKTIAKKWVLALSQANKGINIFAVRSNVNLLRIKLCKDDKALDTIAQSVADGL